MSTCRIFQIEGRVQGVWFRESTRQQAERLGLNGHAVNKPDGSVEVLACGDRVDDLAAWLEEGPPLARVSTVHSRSYDGDCPAGFSTG